MPPPNQEHGNPATECGIRDPSAREVDLERQVTQAQQKLDDLRKQLEAEKARQQENCEAKKQRFYEVLAENELDMRLSRLIQKVDLAVMETLPERLHVYQSIQHVFRKVWRRRKEISFDRLSDGDLDALEEVGAFLEKDEEAMGMLNEDMPWASFSVIDTFQIALQK
ncbi:hypothetical protein NpPPO83_00011514 [Neofusicoccum parvum]|uniref:Uncharacterized protein n=1 Tax=Neofusicoccum parvum TaxID=310453 RepID=A0ACB5S2B6_9PEZI|nr:hypothetical protein NpPPO83_00011514 [Neofusicoccum parvum]